MELAPLTKKDLPELAKLMRAASPDLGYVDEGVLDAKTFQDPDCDIAFLIKAVEKKATVGACLGVARKAEKGKAGYVKAVVVAEKLRRQGVGSLMFSELERRFQKRECREVHVGECPAPYLQTGVDSLDTATVCFLLKRGYQRLGANVDMTSQMKDVQIDYSDTDKKVMKDNDLRKATARDSAALQALVQAAFPGWRFEAANALEQGTVFVAGTKGKVTAFACANGTNPGWFGPMGTLESERGKGLGRLLIWKCFEVLKKDGYKSVRIPWVGPIPFYSRNVAATLGPLSWHFMKRL